MRHVFRHLFTLATPVSLLLCVAVCVLWVRGYAGADEFVRRETSTLRLHSASGRLMVEKVSWSSRLDVSNTGVWSYSRSAPAPGPTAAPGWRPPGPGRFWRALGLHYADGPGSAGVISAPPFRRVEVPHGYVAALAAVLPALWVARVAVKRRRARDAARRNVCPTCGYDLRASPERCPECGTPAPASAASPASAVKGAA